MQEEQPKFAGVSCGLSCILVVVLMMVLNHMWLVRQFVLIRLRFIVVLELLLLA